MQNGDLASARIFFINPKYTDGNPTWATLAERSTANIGLYIMMNHI